MSFICKTNASIDERYYATKHKSGLEVYVIPKKMTTAYAIFGTKFGSIDNHFITGGRELVLPDGIAHFLEHKMFENEDGTDTFARYAKTGANANAYTTFERTCYLFSATEKVEQSLEILLDFVTHPYFTDATVQKEMGIIGQEIRMYDDNPGWQLYFGMLTGLYHANTVRIDTAGTTETIAEITPELLNEAYRAFYNLHNMVLCVCGDIASEQVEAVCDKVLHTAQEPRVERLYPAEPQGIFKEYVSKRLEVSMPMFAVGIKDDDTPCPGKALAQKQAQYDLLPDMMFGKSSAFFTRM
ncbi:MAG: EF-P 5-aminopentanol modification-associated protein YfmH, partial [Eubacteriales bacterium]